MIIIKASGGLGNQLFEYGLYYSFLKKNIPAYLDFDWYQVSSEASVRKNRLLLFDSEINISPKKYRLRYSNYGNELYAKIKRKLHVKEPFHFHEKEPGTYDENIYHIKNGYLSGYWQNENYFKQWKKELCEKIQFPVLQDGEFNHWAKQVEDSEAVCVHIRLGDYEKITEIYGGCATVDYYIKALEYIQSKLKNPVFYVFSDEVEKAKKIITCQNAVFISQKGKEEYYDLELMRRCKHHIIANSSFSWWAAWLADQENQIVIAPKKWTADNSMKNPACDSWIKM